MAPLCAERPATLLTVRLRCTHRHMDDPNINDPLPADAPSPPAAPAADGGGLGDGDGEGVGVADGVGDDDGDADGAFDAEMLADGLEEELVIRVAGCERPGCNGDFYFAGERNDRPCFTNQRGAGALYFDGTFWKICQIGEGPVESGWNYSQKPGDEPGAAARLPPLGAWTREHANQGEASVEYGAVLLECLSAEEAAASPAPDGASGAAGLFGGERRPADFASWLAERGRAPQRAARRVTLASDDDPNVQMIMAMGFTMNAAKKSLHFSRNDIERAVEWIMLRVGTDPTLDDEFDPNYDPATALIQAIDSMAPNLEERLEALNTEVLMQTGEPGSGMENPESQMKIASALIKMLQRPHATDDARIPLLREWACRTLTNFSKVNRKIEGFLRDDRTLLVLLSCLGSPHRNVNQEVVNVLSDLAKGDSTARTSILRAGGLDSVLNVAAREARSISAALPEQALTLASELVRSFNPKEHRVTTVGTSLCALLVHTELRVRVKTLECYSALIDSFRAAEHPLVQLLQVDSGAMPKFLVASVRLQNELCATACGLLRSLCTADEDSLKILVEEGLFDAIVAGIADSSASGQQELCSLIVSLVDLLYSDEANGVTVGDDVDVMVDPGQSETKLSGPIFQMKAPHEGLTVGCRVTHAEHGDGTVLGWKHSGDRTGDTSGGLQSDGYCRIKFDSGKGGGGWNVPGRELNFAGGPKFEQGTIVADCHDGTYLINWRKPGRECSLAQAEDVKLRSGALQRGARVRARKRPMGFSNFGGGYYDATIVNVNDNGTVHVTYDDEERDDPELPQEKIEKFSVRLSPTRKHYKLSEDLHKQRDAYAQNLLPLLLKLNTQSSQVQKKHILEATVHLADRMGSSAAAGHATIDKDLIVQISQTVNDVFAEKASMSSLLFAVQLASATLRMEPATGLELLRRYGIVEHVTKLSECSGLVRTPSSDSTEPVVTAAAKHFLSKIEQVDVDESSEVPSALLALAARVSASDAAAVDELADLLRQPDGITQYEFESAGLVGSVLSLVSKKNGVDMLRRAMDAECFTRFVHILQSVLSTHEQLNMFTSSVSVSSLSEPVKLQFKKDAGCTCGDIADVISVEPIVRARQLELYVRGTSACKDAEYLEYCDALVGCQVDLMSRNPLSRALKSYEWHCADVISFDPTSGRHLCLFEKDGTALSLMMQGVEHEVKRGRYAAHPVDLSAVCNALGKMAEAAPAERVRVLPVIVKKLSSLLAVEAGRNAGQTLDELRMIDESDAALQELLQVPGGPELVSAVGFVKVETNFELPQDFDAKRLAGCKEQITLALQSLPMREGEASTSETSAKSAVCAEFDRGRCGEAVRIHDGRAVSFNGHSSVLLNHSLVEGSGTWLVDIKCLSGGNALVGAATEDYDVNTYLGDAAGGYWLFARGGVRSNRSWSRPNLTRADNGFKDGDTLRVEINTDNRTVLMLKNSSPVHEEVDISLPCRFALGGSSGGKFELLSTHLETVASMDVAELSAGARVCCKSGPLWKPATLMHKAQEKQGDSTKLQVIFDGCEDVAFVDIKHVKCLAVPSRRPHHQPYETGAVLARQWSALDTDVEQDEEFVHVRTPTPWQPSAGEQQAAGAGQAATENANQDEEEDADAPEQTATLPTGDVPVQPKLCVCLKMLGRAESMPRQRGGEKVTEGNAQVGMRVVRGDDWKWNDQDKNGVGTIAKPAKGGWVAVKWDHGSQNSYRCEGKYDLRRAVDTKREGGSTVRVRVTNCLSSEVSLSFPVPGGGDTTHKVSMDPTESKGFLSMPGQKFKAEDPTGKVVGSWTVAADSRDQRFTIGEETTGFVVTGAGADAANGVYKPVVIPSYSGAQCFSNGAVAMFRWQRKHWVMSDLGDGRDNWDESRWIYAVEASGPLPPLSGWKSRNGKDPVPTLAAAVSENYNPEASAEVHKGVGASESSEPEPEPETKPEPQNPKSSQPPRWQVESDEGWKNFDEDFQVQLTAAADASVSKVTLERGRWQYEVNLEEMTQTNLRTQKVRSVRVQRPRDVVLGTWEMYARVEGKDYVRKPGEGPDASTYTVHMSEPAEPDGESVLVEATGAWSFSGTGRMQAADRFAFQQVFPAEHEGAPVVVNELIGTLSPSGDRMDGTWERADGSAVGDFYAERIVPAPGSEQLRPTDLNVGSWGMTLDWSASSQASLVVVPAVDQDDVDTATASKNAAGKAKPLRLRGDMTLFQAFLKTQADLGQLDAAAELRGTYLVEYNVTASFPAKEQDRGKELDAATVPDSPAQGFGAPGDSALSTKEFRDQLESGELSAVAAIAEFQHRGETSWLARTGLVGSAEDLAPKFDAPALCALYAELEGIPFGASASKPPWTPSVPNPRTAYSTAAMAIPKLVLEDHDEDAGLDLAKSFSATKVRTARISGVQGNDDETEEHEETVEAALASCGDETFRAAIKLLAMLHRDEVIVELVQPTAWVNSRLSSKLRAQLSDAVAIVSGALPEWCNILGRGARFLFQHEVRCSLLQCAFGPSRIIHRVQQEMRAAAGTKKPSTSAGSIEEQLRALSRRRGGRSATIGALVKEKVVMETREREENFLPRAKALLEEHAGRRTVLEVEIGGAGEHGTGEGVHAEFFTVCAAVLQSRALNAETPMWVDASDDKAAEHLLNATGLFPKPLPQLRVGATDDDSASDHSADLRKRLKDNFRFLGRLFGKALMDNRIVPLPLHPLFLDCVVGRSVGRAQLAQLIGANEADSEIAKKWPGGTLVATALAIERAVVKETAKMQVSTELLAGSEQELEPEPEQQPESAASRLESDAAAAVAGRKLAEACPGIVTEDSEMTVAEYLEYGATFDDPGNIDPTQPAPLIDGGSERSVTVECIGEYLDAVQAQWLGNGVALQRKAFAQGLGEVFSVDALLAFTGAEIVAMVSNTCVCTTAADAHSICLMCTLSLHKHLS